MKNKALENVTRPSLKNKYLYVLEFSNGTVKIGITKEKEKRMKAISSASGMDITRSYFTGKIDNVQNLETELHRHFKDKRLNGEFFDINFNEAVAEVEKRAGNLDWYVNGYALQGYIQRLQRTDRTVWRNYIFDSMRAVEILLF